MCAAMLPDQEFDELEQTILQDGSNGRDVTHAVDAQIVGYSFACPICKKYGKTQSEIMNLIQNLKSRQNHPIHSNNVVKFRRNYYYISTDVMASNKQFFIHSLKPVHKLNLAVYVSTSPPGPQLSSTRLSLSEVFLQMVDINLALAIPVSCYQKIKKRLDKSAPLLDSEYKEIIEILKTEYESTHHLSQDETDVFVQWIAAL